MEEMRKKRCQQMKIRIFEHVAPARYGKVSLTDMSRLFSHLGSPTEIEKCLDEFVKEKIANKVEIGQGKFYVFEELALRFGKKWSEELASLKEQYKALENEVLILRQKLGAIEKMRDMWVGGWEDVLKDSELYSSVSNYVASVFFGQRVERVLKNLKKRNRELRTANLRTKDLEKRLRESYERVN